MDLLIILTSLIFLFIVQVFQKETEEWLNNHPLNDHRGNNYKDF